MKHRAKKFKTLHAILFIVLCVNALTQLGPTGFNINKWYTQRDTDNFIQASFLRASVEIQMKNGFIFLQLVNQAYVAITKSWICHAPQHTLKHTIFLATDKFAFRALRDFNVSLVFLISYSTGSLSYGQRAYYDLMLFRSTVILKLLDVGVNVWLIESDAVWFDDPTIELSRFSDIDVITGQDGNINDNIPEGGFIFLNSTVSTRNMWRRLRLEHKKILSKLHADEVGDAGSEMLLLPKYLASVKWRFFSRSKFVSGKWYRDKKMRERAKPIVIQNNWIIGNHNKTLRARAWGHWYLNDAQNACQIPTDV